MNSLRPWLLGLLACCWLAACAPSAQAGGLAVEDLAVLVDAGGSETIASVSAAAASGRFRAAPGGLSAGYTRDVHWLRFTIQVPAAGPWWLSVEPAVLDDLRLFEPVGDGFVERRSGDRLPFGQREVAYRAFVFKLAVPDTARRTVYLRVQTRSSALVQLALWQPEAFDAAKALEYAGLGVYFGLAGMLLLVNGVLWATLRQSMYGWFGLHVVAHMLAYWCLLGLASQFGLSGWPRLADFCVPLSMVLFLASGIPFLQRLLQVEARHRLVQAIFWSQRTLPWLLIPAYFTDRYAEVMSLVLGLATLVAPCVLWISLSRAKQGRREATWILLGTSITLAGLWWHVMGLLGWHGLGTSPYLALLLSSVGSLMAMQLALGAQVLQLLDDRRLAQQAAMAAERDAAVDRHARDELAALLADKDALLTERERAQGRLGHLVAALQQAQRHT